MAMHIIQLGTARQPEKGRQNYRLVSRPHKERTMDQAERKTDFGTWLRQIWNAVMLAAEAMDRSPMDDVFDRLDQLEREMAVLKNRKAAGIDDPM
jgi:hypothetical protein